MPEQTEPRQTHSVLSWFASQSLRLIGLFLVVSSGGLLVFLILLDVFVGIGSPYIGIVTYMILPLFLIIGLILVPLDAWIRRRRRAAGRPEYLEIDFNDPTVRRVGTFFVVSGALVLILMTVAVYRGIEFMDTVTFCGKVCHRVMDPEYTAYLRSPHADVGCVSCHIGPGASWFVRSKISGVPQVYHYITDTYPRPLPTPVVALRPSRDTCENCHWPLEFYGNLLLTRISYKEDKDNTEVITTQVMKVGSGGIAGAGIHSHIARKIYYLPGNKKRSEIAWVRVEQKNRPTLIFVNPSFAGKITQKQIQNNLRLMDCIDCHNRPAHNFIPFEQILDAAITRQKIPRDLPYVKREAVSAVGEITRPYTDDRKAKTLRRIEKIEQFYRKNYPKIYDSDRQRIKSVVAEVKRVYNDTVFPMMNVGPDTYPNWRTHTGCFRCHGTIVRKGKTEPLSQDCSLCHAMPVQGSPVSLMPE